MPGNLGAAAASMFATSIPWGSTLGCGIEALSCDVALTTRFSKMVGIPLGVVGLFYFGLWTGSLRHG